MKYTDRRILTYDSEVFKRADVQTALMIHAEMIKKHSSIPFPKVMEVRRDAQGIDPLWHMPISRRTEFDRTLDLPAIVTFEKARIKLKRWGRGIEQLAKVWVSQRHLEELNYFPLAGDIIAWGGYRFAVLEQDFEPSAYWGQTNIWLGLVLTAAIMPDGDVTPVVVAETALPAEKSPIYTGPAPKVLPEL